MDGLIVTRNPGTKLPSYLSYLKRRNWFRRQSVRCGSSSFVWLHERRSSRKQRFPKNKLFVKIVRSPRSRAHSTLPPERQETRAQSPLLSRVCAAAVHIAPWKPPPLPFSLTTPRTTTSFCHSPYSGRPDPPLAGGRQQRLHGVPRLGAVPLDSRWRRRGRGRGARLR
jgi:hypothetical protein